jgi:iron complex outermembrane recepter protein
MAKAAIGVVPGSRIKTARQIRRRNAPLVAAVSAAFAAMAGAPLAHAEGEDATAASPLENIVVTAQKRTENLQEVPFAIQAFTTEKLEELHVEGLDDYVKFMPSVSYVRSQGEGDNGQPGTAHVYIRGVVSGGDGNHSGPLPSVGTYLDEQPVTTIDGNLDVHIYDIERIEVLEGPQGTLYGASSESGTIRIITNKPDPKKFSAGYDVGLDKVNHGGIGSIAEGYINLPIADHAAIRLVGWDEHDAGYISNVAGTNASAGIVNGIRTFPLWDQPGYNGGIGQISNAAYVKSNYNTVATKGGRAALRLDLNDSWTITPTFMAQSTSANGFFGMDPAVGDLKVAHFGPESSSDSFAQSALTIEGKLYDLDVTYAGAWMKRDSHSVAEYSDYSFFYEVVDPSVQPFYTDNAGKNINPQQIIYGDNWFTKLSHELRLSTPKRYPVRATVGAFTQRQTHEIYQNYVMPGFNGDGLADALSVPGWAYSFYLADLERVDKDEAIFGQLTWDINPHWALTGGLRQFWADNSLSGFYGGSTAGAAWLGVGVPNCGPPGGTPSPTYLPFRGAPCTDLQGETKESGHTPLLTLTYFGEEDKMLYATYSKGFRPGGVNRARDPNTHLFLAPYNAEYLTNFEFGWKTQWDNKRIRWNGALFRENWDNFQFAFLVPPSLTAVANAGKARINGFESELEWAIRGGWSLGLNLSLTDGKLAQDFADLNGVEAPSGTRLPVAPEFKLASVARYAFAMGDWKNNVQATFAYQTDSTPLLIVKQAQAAGTQPAFGLVDLSGGGERDKFSYNVYLSNLFDTRAQLTRFAECKPTVCSQTYFIPAQPRTIGFKIGQKF